MFIQSRVPGRPLILLLLLAAAAPARAQFGTAMQQTMLGASDFQPLSSTTTYASSGGGYIHRTGGADDAFWARVPLPNGAVIKDVCIFYYDANAGLDVSADVSIYGLAENSGESPDIEQIGGPFNLADPAGTQFSKACLLNDLGDEVVHTLADVNNNQKYSVYKILVRLPATDNTTRLGGALIRWQRLPAVFPGTSFTDLFTQPPGTDAAEALYQSGITEGCGAGNFCPNDPVTRLQLAKMLHRALGLYWPE